MRHWERMMTGGFLLLIFLVTGCREKPFLPEEEGAPTAVSGEDVPAAAAEKIYPDKPWVYEERMEDPELREVLKHPIVNMRSAYAKSVNDFINAQLAQLSSKNDERKRSEQPMLTFQYGVYEHERFVSLLTEIREAEGDVSEKMSFNIDLTTGAEMKPDDLGEYLGFDGDLQQRMEEGILFAYGDPATFTEETRRFAGSSLENFWSLEYRGYPQYYVRDHALYILCTVYDPFGSYQQEMPIYPVKGGGNDSRNPLAKALQVPDSSDLAVAYLGKGTDAASVERALQKGRALLSSAGYQRTPSLLMRMDEGRGMKSEDYYLIVPKDRHAVLRLTPIDSTTKLPTSDLTRRDDFVWDSAYIVCVNHPEQPANARLESVYRGRRQVFEPTLRSEDGSEVLTDSALFDLGAQLKSGEESVGYPVLLDQILWSRSQNASLE